MVIKNDHLCTVLPVWSPKYSTQYETNGEWVVLLSKFKMRYASPIVKVDFTKAKHLKGQRFAIRRTDVEKCPVVSNGRIDCYAVNMSKLEAWETPQEEYQKAMEAFND